MFLRRSSLPALALMTALLGGCATSQPISAFDAAPSPVQQALDSYQFSQAKAQLAQAAAQGDNEAQAFLAAYGQWLDSLCALENGPAQPQADEAQRLLVPAPSGQRDYRQAAFWAQRAADANNPMGQFLIGYLHELGFGATPDKALAFDYYHKAAAQGLTAAKHRLALLAQRDQQS
ncbi:tetratricopeptide repeat protein [Gallaecimonas xiamenensis]|uniref:Sel1 domain-containing protein n=1 Tax=Gallaecimonas xiamenensis 3-C-1 TaxID=745411 RepID=K2JRX2_9GAMM|nr:SEL1-like repeat protein [Gallaecimonas xiamenensis]EKE67935.1 Sel1 domain-containing protein [Gallaecimonas xiamenensis 3-C-1]